MITTSITKTVERITIDGPTEEHYAMIAYCQDNGYKIVELGSGRNDRGDQDITVFRVVAEKEITLS